MPAPTIAPNPYDVPVQINQAAKALLDKGKLMVAQAKIKARRHEFAERVATWPQNRIVEEIAKIDEAVKAHEQKIAECLRRRMILEDQLVVCASDEVFEAHMATESPGVAVVRVGVSGTDPNCPF